MGRCLIKIRDRYFEWSTIVDAPVTCAMTEEELRAHIKARYGEGGTAVLDKRIAACNERGTSMERDLTLDDVLSYNRAGRDETELTADEIYAGYASEAAYEIWMKGSSGEE